MQKTEAQWDRLLTMLEQTIQLVVDDNKFIKKDADVFRSIVKKGFDEGNIKFTGK